MPSDTQTGGETS